MKTKTLFLIGTSIVLSSAFVTVLFLTSFDFTKQKNDFLRHFLPHVIFASDTIDVKYPTYYIAGGTEEHIYLGNHQVPLHVLDINTATSDTSFIRIKLKGIDSIQYWSFKLRIDSPYFFLGDGTIPVIFRGKINDTKTWLADREVYDSAYFVEYVPTGPSSFAIRTLSGITGKHELGKETAAGKPHITFNHDLLRKQIDGVFCTDGKLNFDKHFGRVAYTHFYKNEIIVADTMMNLIYRSKTIDTVSRVQIKVDTIRSNDTSIRSAPPVYVNRLSTAALGYLFVNSALLAKNENVESFNNASVIDTYDLSSGTYKMSFYVHKLQNNKMKEFNIINNRLVVLYKTHIVVYDLAQALFPTTKHIFTLHK